MHLEDNQTPLARLGSDRVSLLAAGMRNETIDRIFRALFVYSMGFQETIDSIIEHSLDRDRILAKIWRLYGMLLEY
jgi:hypothetical protein